MLIIELLEDQERRKGAPVRNDPLHNNFLQPKEKQVVRDILNGATRKWVSDEYGISLNQIAVYLMKARKAGIDIPLNNPWDERTKKNEKMRAALLKKWDVSVHELKTILRTQNEKAIRTMRSQVKAQLRKEFPGKFPAPEKEPTRFPGDRTKNG